MFQLSFSVLLFTAFIRGLPEELEESARPDGDTTWGVFRRIVFPMMAPMSATVATFTFLASWDDFMMPSLITPARRCRPCPCCRACSRRWSPDAARARVLATSAEGCGC
jgi:ABC-type glycerol-3-phosphate transport system permease component